MFFGTAKAIITPHIPMELACTGVFGENFIDIHDDTYVRCLVLDDGTEKIVLMSFDLLFHDRILNEKIAEYAFEKYDIKPENIIVSYTHAHTAAAGRGYNPGAENAEYEEELLFNAKRCVDRALCSMIEGTLEYCSFECDFNISRRGIIDGVFRNAPNPDYDRDTEFFVMCLRDIGGEVRSVLMNYGCHPVFYPASLSVSGEFPARVCQLLDTEYYGSTSLFFQSAGGDVRPKPTAGDDGRFINELPFSVVDHFAKEIADSVKTAIEGGNMKVNAFEIPLEMEPKPFEYFDNMHNAYGNAMHPESRNARAITKEVYAQMKKELILHCQAVRLADELYLVSMGGEPCCRVKKAVKETFDGKNLLFIGYTDACAYIVDDRMLDEGGYEPGCHLEYGLIGPFKKGLDKMYTESFKKAFEEIKG